MSLKQVVLVFALALLTASLAYSLYDVRAARIRGEPRDPDWWRQIARDVGFISGFAAIGFGFQGTTRAILTIGGAFLVLLGMARKRRNATPLS